jgi:autotransporter-associated beta strand protein
MRFFLVYLRILFCGILISFLPFPSNAQRQMEKLDHGVLAVKVNNGVFVSWRVLGTEWRGVAYNLYRDSQKINTSPITGASNFLDESGTINSSYYVTAIINNVEQPADDTVFVWEKSYYDIPVRDIPGNYELNDASVGDLDGDGDYEIVVKRLPPDLTVEPEYTPLIEAYHLDGTWMWTIDLGPNLMNMKQINFIVYDLDGDGISEVAIKTSEATIDGTGIEIGDTDGDGITNYRSTAVGEDVINGPEFLSLYEGRTGKEIARTNYISRVPLSQWGPSGLTTAQLAHRADNNMMAIIYADGKRPTLVICRGIYYRTKMIAFNFRNNALTQLWKFDNIDWPPEYTGQGNHSLSVADVDNDGRDEIIYGSMTIDDDGNGLYGTGLGHGDALHVTDMDPDRPGLEIWQAHESSPYWGGTYRDARTGEILIQYVGNRDMGRACAGDITADYRGFEMWGATECPIYNVSGANLGPTNVPVNFMIWWDSDLLREFLDHIWLGEEAGVGIGTISKYNGSGADILLTANGTYSTNYTKGNPCLQADILGDWREEVIWRTTDNKKLRIYTTVNPTEYRIYTLMHDPQYRIAIAWQNNAYNQPPHPGFYLGDGMDSVPPPPMTEAKLVWNSGFNWDLGITASWLCNESPCVFNNGDDVLFDIAGSGSDSVIISGLLTPSKITVFSPYNYSFNGTGSLSGESGLLKAGAGKLTINNQNDFSGYTPVWAGSLFVNGSLMNSHVNVKRFASAGGSGLFGNGVTIENNGSLAIGDKNIPDTLRISGALELQGNTTLFVDLSDDTTGILNANDILFIQGDLIISGKNFLNITPLDETLKQGTYTLVNYSGILSGSVDDIEIKGIPGTPCLLEDTDSSIVLHVMPVRKPTTITWTGEPVSDWDLANNLNWLNQGVPDWFVGNDTVIFNDTGSPHTTVNVTGILPVGEMIVDASVNYKFDGNGMISGNGGLIKNGTGRMTINNINDYTGATILNGGIVEIEGLENAGYPGPFGSSSEGAANLIFNGGKLSITGYESTTNRNITISDAGGTIDIPGGSSYLRINGSLSGNGKLIKSGPGRLTFSSANSYKGGTLLKSGIIKFESDSANIRGFGTGPVTIESGTISMLDNQGSYTDNCDWDIIIPGNGVARLNLDSRSSLTGSLTGNGILNLYTPFIRSELFGDWSGFSGTINVSTDSDGGTFLIGNSNGLSDAAVYLGNNVTMIYRRTSNVTIGIGELSGSGSSRLGAGGEGVSVITWKIGSKNTNAVYPGIICNDQFKNSGATAAIIKTGTGSWTLTGENTYSGGTIVESGKLMINNNTGSGTGTGSISVNNTALLGGTGIIKGKLTVGSGASLAPGNNTTGTLTVNSDVVLSSGCFLAMEVDTRNKLYDQLIVNGTITLGGYLYLMNVGTWAYASGDSIKILTAQKCTGMFNFILPNTPGKGLQWDTTGFSQSGVIRVVSVIGFDDPAYSSKVEIYPNPVINRLFVNFPENTGTTTIIMTSLQGQVLYNSRQKNATSLEIDLSSFKEGIYILQIETEDEIAVKKIVKE